MAGAPSATQAPQGGSTAQAPTAAGGTTPATASVVPFLRGSGKGKYKFYSKSGLTLTTATQDLGPIDVKAYDYMRSILVTLTNTAAGGALGTVQADGPFNCFTNVSVLQPNGQTMYQVSGGHQAAMISKWGAYRAWSDPRSDPNYASTGSASTFAFRIPFELDLRDALGALPNKDAAAPFTIELGLNSTSTIFTTAPGTAPTIKITPILEAYDQPPETLDGKQVQTTPPNMNSLQRWTEQSITMASGSFDARVRKLGNYVRMLIFISKLSTGIRGTTPLAVSGYTASTTWSDPMQIVLDEDVKDNIPLWLWQRDIWEIWGYGGLAGGATALPANDAAGGFDDAVFPYQYCAVRDDPTVEDVAKYLPTIESEDYLLRGQSWGTSVSKLVILKCEVLPRGDIFGDA